MVTKSIGIREFRMKLADYILNSDTPVAITRHGTTVGYFIPARIDRQKVHHAGLRNAAEKPDAMLTAAGFSNAEFNSALKQFRRICRNENNTRKRKAEGDH